MNSTNDLADNTMRNIGTQCDHPQILKSDNLIENCELEAMLLRGKNDFRKIAQLRSHIDLSVHHKIDPNFEENEKKKMSSDW